MDDATTNDAIMTMWLNNGRQVTIATIVCVAKNTECNYYHDHEAPPHRSEIKVEVSAIEVRHMYGILRNHSVFW